MRTSTLFSVIFGGIVIAACASDNSSPNSAVGTVANAKLDASSAVARYVTIGSSSTVTGGNTSIRGLSILVSNKGNSCTESHASSATAVTLSLRGDTITPGTYNVVNTTTKSPDVNEASGTFTSVDSNCKDIVAQGSTGGTVIVSTIDNIHVTGTIDVTFTGGKISGNFDAAYCTTGAANDTGSGSTCPL